MEFENRQKNESADLYFATVKSKLGKIQHN